LIVTGLRAQIRLLYGNASEDMDVDTGVDSIDLDLQRPDEVSDDTGDEDEDLEAMAAAMGAAIIRHLEENDLNEAERLPASSTDDNDGEAEVEVSDRMSED
jgi:hypothetical protein